MTDPVAAPPATPDADDASPYAGTSPVASTGATEGSVTLVEGQTFCVSGRSADMDPRFPHGLFVLDTRVVSSWVVRVDGRRPEPLTVSVDEPFAATFVGHGHPAPGRADAELVVFRQRHVGAGMRERIRVTNHGMDPVAPEVRLTVEADFADLFEVKEDRVRRRGRHGADHDGERLRFWHEHDGVERSTTVTFSTPPEVDAGTCTWRPSLAPGASFEVCVEVGVAIDDHCLPLRFACDGAGEGHDPGTRLAEWTGALPDVRTDPPALARIVGRTGTDLGALRIFDPEHPDVAIVAAGAPWFMTLFGRDSLLTAWMTLIADPSLAEGVLDTLARLQGTEIDPAIDEEPGKILHEVRFGAAAGLTLRAGDRYYGSIDATPLFVMLLGELHRWHGEPEVVDRLLPHADRAIEWIEQFGDRDGDGYVEYQRGAERGLVNQGWKDSWDALRFADGALARPPIALCEVQGYVHAAYVARAHLARERGDDLTADRCAARARDLRRRFDADFWIEERGGYAIGLDADKRPIDAVASNMGHCLWTGIVEPARAAAVAETLLSDEMFSGWGVRTLATSMAAYNPVSYHNGSVWPHDNALVAAGLMRYGHVAAAHRVIEAQLDAAVAHGGRLPELFAGFGRHELGVPASYPASCSPQAWASAAPLVWLRTLLRLEPVAPSGRVHLAPVLPASIRRLEVTGIRIAGRSLDVRVDADAVEVRGADGLEIVAEPHPAVSSVVA
ncbi:MAG TPA: glycogen debranching N-terminal domain-containing protein [Acidimicrobiales bacterium]|nr:glycogen debranching N-terminal domain-containing protein [Acidimicrobiales bacterium]